nr:DUF4910 domain-containing protein [Nitrosarchaeum sp. AC2]
MAYLSKNELQMKEIIGGFILTCVAGPNNIEYKKTFQGNHFLDEIVLKILKKTKIDFKIYDFDINGSDERQYSSSFFRIPIGTICKSKYYEYDYYHTSKDNLEFIKPESLIELFQIYTSVIEEIEEMDNFSNERITISKNKNMGGKFISNIICEPMLSKRNLYPTSGGTIKQKVHDIKKKHQDRTYQNIKEKQITGKHLDAIRWIMFYSDGVFNLEDIIEKANIPYDELLSVANELCTHNLLKIMDEENKL